MLSCGFGVRESCSGNAKYSSAGQITISPDSVSSQPSTRRLDRKDVRRLQTIVDAEKRMDLFLTCADTTIAQGGVVE